MRWFFIIIGGVFLILFSCAFLATQESTCIITGYQEKARTPIFSAFITLGSFLLTLKTAILQRLKDGFDSKSHEDAYLYHCDSGGEPGKYYESLDNMSTALSSAVFFSLLSAACQMTFGFSAKPWAFALCAATPTTTLLVILFLWYEISQAHKKWITKIEEDKKTALFKPKKPKKLPLNIYKAEKRKRRETKQ